MVKTTLKPNESLTRLKELARFIRDELGDDKRFEVEIKESDKGFSLEVKIKKGFKTKKD